MNMAREDKGTTQKDYVNKNGQKNLGTTGRPGTDHMQVVYRMQCGHCGHVYGANGSDIWQRKCPKCQEGAEGPPLLPGER
jgi:hypothetical protein